MSSFLGGVMFLLKRYYVIISYLAFIFSPFIYGVVAIFHRTNYYISSEELTIYVNYGVILALGIATFLFAYFDLLKRPSKTDLMHVIFGVLGNGLVILYIFQDYLQIDQIVTIYAVLIIVLALHSLLISHKIQAKELWVLLIVFSIIDYLRFILTGCTFSERNHCNVDYSLGLILVIMNIAAVVTIFSVTVYKLIKLRTVDLWKGIHVLLVGVLSILYVFGVSPFESSRFLQLLLLLVPFFVIIDYVISLVNRTYKIQTTVFYLRTFTWLVISILLSSYGFSSFSGNLEVLTVMVVATYSTLIISLISSAKRKELAENVAGVELRLATSDDLPVIALQLSKKFEMVPNHLVYVIKVAKNIIGYLVCEISPISVDEFSTSEAHLHEFFVKEEFRSEYVNSTLAQLEACLSRINVSQIRGDVRKTSISLKVLHERKYFIDTTSDTIQFLKTI